MNLDKKINQIAHRILSSERKKIGAIISFLAIILFILVLLVVLSPKLTTIAIILIIKDGIFLKVILTTISAITILSELWFITGKDRSNPLYLLLANLSCLFLLYYSWGKDEKVVMFAIQSLVLVSIVVIAIKELLIYTPKKPHNRLREWKYWTLIGILFLSLGSILACFTWMKITDY